MFGGKQDAPLKPRDGHTLHVGVVARISGCQNQKELSLDDQVDHAKEVVAELFSGKVEFHIVATKGKGERLDRPELAQIEIVLRTGELDLMVMEDLGRLVRGGEAVRLLGIGVDHGTRTISPNDSVDTAEEGWEEVALAACRDHVAHNAHTSKRIKHKTMNRFKKFGGSVPLLIYGYIKPEGAKTYDDWKIDVTATEHIRRGLAILKETKNYNAVADYFNTNHVAVGPYSRRSTWDGKMVKLFYHNPLLFGMPGRGFRHSVKHNESGARISVKNPSGPQFYPCPHLAHVDRTELEEVLNMVDKKNLNLGRKQVNGQDPRLRVPHKRTRFPGQWGTCWYCGGTHVWGGNGISGNLMCGRSRDWQCWNSIGYSGALAAQRVREVITDALYSAEGMEGQFREMVASASRDAGGRAERLTNELRQEELLLEKQKKNLQDSIKAFGPTELVRESLNEFQERERGLALRRRELERLGQHKLVLPESPARLREMLEEQFALLSQESFEFNDLLRKLVPEFHVYLVRLCDGGHMLPRVRVRFALDGIVPDARHVPGLREFLGGVRTLDLFIAPQREQIREASIELAATGSGPKAIAEEIARRGKHSPTGTAVQNALSLHAKMKALGLSTPYVMVSEPPDDYPKLRRHKNPRFQFSTAEGYQPPTL